MYRPLLLLCLAACASTEPVAVVSTAPSFLQSARDAVPEPFEGVVAEVVPAGGYTYLQVENRWVVMIRGERSVGDSVAVRPFGELHTFSSKITGRTFEPLIFASVRSGGV